MDVTGALHSMWNDSVILMTDEGWVIRIAFTAFVLLPVVAAVLAVRVRGWRPLAALGIWVWVTGWRFLQYAIDSWTNPGGAGTFALLLLAMIVGWALVASVLHQQLRRSPTAAPSAQV